MASGIQDPYFDYTSPWMFEWAWVRIGVDERYYWNKNLTKSKYKKVEWQISACISCQNVILLLVNYYWYVANSSIKVSNNNDTSIKQPIIKFQLIFFFFFNKIIE